MQLMLASCCRQCVLAVSEDAHGGAVTWVSYRAEAENGSRIAVTTAPGSRTKPAMLRRSQRSPACAHPSNMLCGAGKGTSPPQYSTAVDVGLEANDPPLTAERWGCAVLRTSPSPPPAHATRSAVMASTRPRSSTASTPSEFCRFQGFNIGNTPSWHFMWSDCW